MSKIVELIFSFFCFVMSLIFHLCLAWRSLDFYFLFLAYVGLLICLSSSVTCEDVLLLLLCVRE